MSIIEVTKDMSTLKVDQVLSILLNVEEKSKHKAVSKYLDQALASTTNLTRRVRQPFFQGMNHSQQANMQQNF